MIKSNQKLLNFMLVILDGFVIALSLLISWYLRFNTRLFSSFESFLDFNTYMMPLILIIPIYIFVYNAFELYNPQRIKKLDSEIIAILEANIIGVLILVNVLFLTKEVHYSRYVIFMFALIGSILSILERIFIRVILRLLRKKGYNLKHILVVGAGELGISFISKVNQNRHIGYNIIGFLDDEKKLGYRISGISVIGCTNDLDKIIVKNVLDEIIIALPLNEYEKLSDIIKVCEKSGVKAQIIPDYYKYLPAKPYIDQLDDLTLINIRYVPLDDAFNKLIKRLMDVFISLTAIIVTFPVMIIVAAWIKLSSPGPILFKQTRVGLHRREFDMYKFRSMRLQNDDEEKTQWTKANDPRKTWIGNIIRKTSIDELPQLFNVLKGDMSIIGPRPERPFFVDKFKEEIPKYMVKHHVRPGITGWAQVNGFRGDTSIKERIKHDIYYIENWNIWLDVKIIFLTFFKGFINKNAY